jgi:hypothetical protein
MGGWSHEWRKERILQLLADLKIYTASVYLCHKVCGINPGGQFVHNPRMKYQSDVQAQQIVHKYVRDTSTPASWLQKPFVREDEA